MNLAGPHEDNERERTYLEASLAICLEAGNQQIRSYVLDNLGNIERYAGRNDEAMENYRDSLFLKYQNGDEWAIAYTLDGCAAIATTRGQGEKAVRLFGAADAIRKRLGTPLESHKQMHYQDDIAEARLLFTAAEFASAWNAGELLSVGDAVDEAAAR